MAVVYMKTPEGKQALVQDKSLDDMLAKGYTIDSKGDEYAKNLKETGSVLGTPKTTTIATKTTTPKISSPQPSVPSLGAGVSSIYMLAPDGRGVINVSAKELESRLEKGFEYVGVRSDEKGLYDQSGNLISANQGTAGSALRSAVGGIEGNINSMYDEQRKMLVAQLKQAIAEARGQYEDVISKVPQTYQPLKDQAELNRLRGMDTLRETIANRGDSGGIGRQQMTEAETASQKQFNEIQMQQQNVIDEANTAIARLEAQGNFQEAQITAEVAMERLRELVAEQQRVDTLDRQQSQWATERQDKLDYQDYLKGRDTLADERYEKEFEWERSPDNPAYAANQLQAEINKLKLENMPAQIKHEAEMLEQEVKKGQISLDEAQYRLDELKNPNSRTNKLLDMEYEIKQLEASNMPERIKLELQALKAQIAGANRVTPRTQQQIDMDNIALETAKIKLDQLKSGNEMSDTEARQIAAELATRSGAIGEDQFNDMFNNILNALKGNTFDDGLSEFFTNVYGINQFGSRW